MIAIIDYDAGNIKSVEKAIQYLGEEVCTTRNKSTILQAEKVVLPGVGSFGNAMQKIRSYELDKVIYQMIEMKKPFLGICLGLQLLFERSEESEGVEGLGILEGSIVRIPSKPELKIPHMGWNSLDLSPRGVLFQEVPKEAYVYFVHSYYLQAEEEAIVKATTSYGDVVMHVSIEKENIFACQFHPEKSSETGLQILQNFISIGREN